MPIRSAQALLYDLRSGPKVCRVFMAAALPRPKSGMLMSLHSVWHPGLGRTLLCAGFESGHVAVWDAGGQAEAPLLALTQVHQEPVLTTVFSPNGSFLG